MAGRNNNVAGGSKIPEYLLNEILKNFDFRLITLDL
jgi:hypothetical protein